MSRDNRCRTATPALKNLNLNGIYGPIMLQRWVAPSLFSRKCTQKLLLVSIPSYLDHNDSDGLLKKQKILEGIGR